MIIFNKYLDDRFDVFIVFIVDNFTLKKRALIRERFSLSV